MRYSSTSAKQITPSEIALPNNLERQAALHAFRMANRFMKTRTWDTAILWLNQATKIRPEFFEAYFLLGEVHLELGDWREAVEAYKKAIQLRPDDTTPHLKLGHAYIALNDWNSALGEYYTLRSLNEVIANDLFDKIIHSFNYEMFNSLFNNVREDS
jgi:tetratricopeptide (TPR) repeat protein